MKNLYRPIIFILIVIAHHAAPVAAGTALQVSDDIQYLFRLAHSPQAGQPFDPAQVADLIKHIRNRKSVKTNATSVVEGAFAFHAFTIDRDLADILRYAYNPRIPAYALTPSSVRLCYWQPLKDGPAMTAELERLSRPTQQPVVVRGIEHVEITPDISTGAYYRYDEDRTMIRYDTSDQNILISLSKQRDRSDVGRQGYVVGNDSDWNYLYSPEKGLSLSGLGWIKAYMYDSFSIMIFSQPIGQGGPVTCAIFKWLDAGWANLNMVKRKHIMRGIQRFAKDFKAIIEAPDLPPADQMAAHFNRFKNLSAAQLKADVGRHLDALAQYCRQNGEKKILDRVLDKDYLNTLNRKQMEAVLVVEFIKCLLGKNNGGIPCNDLAPADIYPTRRDGLDQNVYRPG